MSANRAAPVTFRTARGQLLTLGQPLAKGGEGSIYPVPTRPDVVAKIYHQPASPAQAAKLAAMARVSSDRLCRLTAWPLELLHDQSGRAVRGFLMPWIRDYHDIHILYGPKTRLREFPQASFPFLIHAAANLARLFAVIHEHGHVIGDVNHGSVLVSQHATTRLVDCDSFQIAERGKYYRCNVGTPTHTPPELQGKSLATLTRTPNHDAFGLAVLIFQLLFLGRHPYSGTPLKANDLPLEHAIAQYRYAYGPGALSRQVRQPPHTPPVNVATEPIAALFERAFVSTNGRPPTRPTAREWEKALTVAETQLTPCAVHAGHAYAQTLTTCPWCAIERAAQGRLTIFNVLVRPSRAAATRRPAFDLVGIWAKIMSVPDPGPAPTLPALPAINWYPTAKILGTAGGGCAIGCVVSAAAQPIIAATCLILGLTLALAVLWLTCAPARIAARKTVHEARRQTHELADRWREQAGNEAFLVKRGQLEKVRQEYHDLPTLRQRRITQLQATVQQRQQAQYLDRYDIAVANIPNIGAGRKATLQSYGIETAADVTPKALQAIPGFGPTLTHNLLTWRASLEAKFVFQAQQGIAPADLAALDREIATKQRQLEQTLHTGLYNLQRLSQQVTTARTTLLPAIAQAHHDLTEAIANL